MPYYTYNGCVTEVGMRYFTIIDFQDMVLALSLGLCVLILIYLSWAVTDITR